MPDINICLEIFSSKQEKINDGLLLHPRTYILSCEAKIRVITCTSGFVLDTTVVGSHVYANRGLLYVVYSSLPRNSSIFLRVVTCT